MSKFYSLGIRDFRLQPYDLSKLQGKVVLCVNVASQCGFTPQYKGLETLYQKYKDQDLVILGFPTNDFYQEPLEGEGLVESCQRNFGVSFQIMEKIHVNGPDEHPVYSFLKSEKKGIFGLSMVKWNFEKFLIDKKGTVVRRFASTSTPESIEPYIVEQLKN